MDEGKDPRTIDREVGQEGGDEGIPWVCGDGDRAGGIGQPPIEPVRCALRAGWAVELGGSVSGGEIDGPVSAEGQSLALLWETRDQFEEWVVEATGDVQLRTCRGCTHATVPAMGLRRHLEDEIDEMSSLMESVVDRDNPLTESERETFGGVGIQMTDEVISRLRSLDPRDRQVMGRRLAANMALLRTVERAFAGARLIGVAGGIQEFRQAASVTEELKRARDRLLREVRLLNEEAEIRRNIVGNSTSRILDEIDARARRARGLSRPSRDAVRLDDDGLPLEPDDEGGSP
jgi:integrating conjugative element protein (TIGR03755 family)